jgi:hypothetical protein
MFGGHPPGVGAAHQPRAEGSIPDGESFGRGQFWKHAGRLWEAPLKGPTSFHARSVETLGLVGILRQRGTPFGRSINGKFVAKGLAGGTRSFDQSGFGDAGPASSPGTAPGESWRPQVDSLPRRTGRGVHDGYRVIVRA